MPPKPTGDGGKTDENPVRQMSNKTGTIFLLSAIILRSGHAGERPDELRAHWTEQNRAAVRRATELLSEIWETERFDLSTLSVAVRSIRSLVASSI